MRKKHQLLWASLAIILLGSLLFRLLAVRLIPFNYDEGHWLMFGSLSNMGYTPYQEVFVGIPPLALLTIQLGDFLFQGPPDVRYPMMLYSLVGLLALFWLVKQQATANPILAAGLAALILSFHPEYFSESVTILTEVPSISMALLAVALTYAYQLNNKYYWLVLSGVVFGFSLGLKVFMVFIPIIIGIQLILAAVNSNQASPVTPSNSPSTGSGGGRNFPPHEGGLRDVIYPPLQNLDLLKLAQSATAWLAGFGLVLGLFLLLYNPLKMYQQVLEFRFLLREQWLAAATNHWLIDNLQIFFEKIRLYWPWLVGGVTGIFLAKSQGLGRVWIWWVWLALATILLLFQVPLRPRYMVMLVPPLAAFCGLAGGYLASFWTRLFKEQAYWLTVPTLLLILVLILMAPIQIITAPLEVYADNAYSRSKQPDILTAVRFLQQTTSPAECVIVDDQRFSFQAQRFPPPSLSETSEARIEVGWLSTKEIMQAADQYHCPALVMISNRFKQLSNLQQSAQSAYSLEYDIGDVAIYAFRLNATHQPNYKVSRTIGDIVTLTGIDLTPPPWHGGQKVYISTYWLTQQKMDTDYKIFMHLQNAQGEVVYNADHFPFEFALQDPTSIAIHQAYRQGQQLKDFLNYPATGLLPTRLWLPNHTLKETRLIVLPDSIPAGNYIINVGLYNPVTQERLPVQDKPLAGGQIPIAEIPITIVQ